MDEKKLLEKIRESAGYIDAPESLHPEQIEDMVQEAEQKRKKLPIYRMGAAAVVVVISLAALWQAEHSGVLKQGGAYPREMADQVLTEAAENAMDAMEDTEAGGTETEDAEVQESADKAVIPHVASEDALYQALMKMSRLRDRGMGIMADGAAPMDMEMEMAAAEDAEESANTMEKTAPQEASGDYSQTNIQEMGIDEGDVVKTDGKYIYTLTGSTLRIVKADGAELSEVSEITLPDQMEQVREIYLDGDTLSFVTTGGQASIAPYSGKEKAVRTGEKAEDAAEEDIYYMDSRQYTRIYTYDISRREEPKITGSMEQEGYYRTSRKNGDMIYLFTEYSPLIRETREASSYLPKVGGARMLIDDIYLPDGAGQSSYLVISSMDVKQPEKVVDRKAIVSAAQLFYVSGENIYIGNNWYENGTDTTRLMKFSYREGQICPAVAGEVRGYVNDSFSFNESDGYLRMVVTEWGEQESLNHLYILDEDLAVCGKLENLAPGETIRSARFFGNTGYFVTFRNMDPLFSVDLSDPGDPKLLGELKITGFSSYLHFYGENRLLGIGDEVDPESGEYKGIKLSMFDISDPANVKEIDKYVMKDKYDCPGLYNYKAILADPQKNLLGFECNNDYQVFSWEEGEGFVRKFLYEMQEGDYAYNMRGLYIGENFYLSQDSSIEAFDMANAFEKTGEFIYQ